MYVCNYCGRHLKKKYDKCPGCGSNSFKEIQNYGEEIIKTPPKDGYKVNLKNFKYEKKFHWSYSIGGIFMFVFVLLGLNKWIFPILKDNDFSFLTRIFILFVVILLVFALPIKTLIELVGESHKIRNNSNNDIKKAQYLSKNGVLVKNLKYEIEPIDKKINDNQTVYIIKVTYEFEKGKTKCFKSEPKYLTALGSADGTVDLLIDPNDSDNYFIDFEIY